MKRNLLFCTLAFLLAAASAVGGYWWGFRQAWGLAQMADAGPRGALAIEQLHQLEKGTSEPIRLQLESEIDLGLTWWHQIDEFPLRFALNTLSGTDVIPEEETYVRRLAVYRKEHPSPLEDPSLNQQLLDNARKLDPAIAKDLEDSGREHRRIVQEMLERYGQ